MAANFMVLTWGHFSCLYVWPIEKLSEDRKLIVSLKQMRLLLQFYR